MAETEVVYDESDEIDEPEDDEAPPPAPAPARRGRPPGKRNVVPETTAQREDEIDLRSWLETIGSKQDVKIQVIRKGPRYFKGTQIEGLCDSFNELIDDEFIKERFGGGLYQIAVHKRSLKHGGRMNFWGSRMLRIAGDPKIDDMMKNNSALPEDDNVAGQAMRTMHQLTKNAMEKAERAERERGNNGMDPMLLQAIVEPLQRQISSLETGSRDLQRIIADKDARLLEMMAGVNRRPDGPTFQDRMLEKMVDGESARIESLRTNHEAELRQLKNIHQAELDRERNRLEDEIRRTEKRHERELDAMRDSNRVAMDAQKTAYETRIDQLKSDVKRLDGDLAANKVELAELRAKKDKSLPDQAKEIVAMQEALTSLGIGGKDEDDDEGKSTLERIATRVMDNPEAIGQLLGGVRGAVTGGEQQPQMTVEQMQAMQAQQHQAMLIQQAQAKQLARKRAARRAKAQQAEAIAKTAEASGIRPPDPNEVRLALSFMESAIQNGTDPASFAATAKSAVPGDVLAYIEKVGIDEILNAANLPQDSLLRTQKGRNFSRAVARYLLEGTAA
jgi:hypothetical protein